MFNNTGFSTNISPILFGGYLSAVADDMLGMATFTVLENDSIFSTSDLRVQFFRPIQREKILVTASVININRSSIHVEAIFRNNEGKLAAKASATQMLRKKDV